MIARPYGNSASYLETFEHFEKIMLRHSGRPHWSKSHPLTRLDIEKMYPRFTDFMDVLEKYDPSGIYRNEYVRRHIFGEDLGENPYKSN